MPRDQIFTFEVVPKCRLDGPLSETEAKGGYGKMIIDSKALG